MIKKVIGPVLVGVGVFFVPTLWPHWSYAPYSGLVGLLYYWSTPPERRRTRLSVWMAIWFGLPFAAWLSHAFIGFP